MSWDRLAVPARRNFRICISSWRGMAGRLIRSAEHSLPTRRDVLHRPPARTGTALWLSSEYPVHYTPTIVHRVGLATEVPEKERALHDGYPQAAPANAPALVGYTILLGALSGTLIETAVSGPDGGILFRDRHSIDEDRARYFAYAGKRRKSGRWEPGVYRAEFTVSGESPAGSFPDQAHGGDYAAIGR